MLYYFMIVNGKNDINLRNGRKAYEGENEYRDGRYYY